MLLVQTHYDHGMTIRAYESTIVSMIEEKLTGYLMFWHIHAFFSGLWAPLLAFARNLG